MDANADLLQNHAPRYTLQTVGVALRRLVGPPRGVVSGATRLADAASTVRPDAAPGLCVP